MCKISYHPLIKPYANNFSNIVAGILGWRLLKPEEFLKLLKMRGGNDRIALASEALKLKKKNLTFSFKKSVGPLVSGSIDHNILLSSQAQQLLGHCWEILKQNKIVPNFSEPIFEFYRHIRNGCYHGNRFYFRDKEPKYPAIWRDLIIDKSLQDKRVFRLNLSEKEYFLNWGDSLLLLSDVSDKIT